MVTLLKLCTSYIARKIHLFENNENLIYLPNHIKDEILTIATRTYKGLPSNILFKALLHKNVKQINLSTSTINDETLQILSRLCPNLEVLIIDGKHCSLTKEGMLHTIPKLTKLTELHLGDCLEVDNDILFKVSQSCSNLSIFNLIGCKDVNDDCFDNLEKLQLIELNISGTGITDKFLKKLKDSALSNFLEGLNISNCKITCEGLKYLPWSKLKYIGFRGCRLSDVDFITDTKSIQFLEFTF